MDATIKPPSLTTINFTGSGEQETYIYGNTLGGEI